MWYNLYVAYSAAAKTKIKATLDLAEGNGKGKQKDLNMTRLLSFDVRNE